MNTKAIELIQEALELLTPKEVKLTLAEIVADGTARMGEAVEAVIVRHERAIDGGMVTIRTGLPALYWESLNRMPINTTRAFQGMGNHYA